MVGWFGQRFVRWLSDAAHHLSTVFAGGIERAGLHCEVERMLRVQLNDAELQRIEIFGALAAYEVRYLPLAACAGRSVLGSCF